MASPLLALVCVLLVAAQDAKPEAKPAAKPSKRQAAQEAEATKQKGLKDKADQAKAGAKVPAKSDLEAAPARCVELILARQESLTEGEPKA